MRSTKKQNTAIFVGVVLFVLAVFLTDWLLDNFELTGALRALVAVLPIVPLTYWWRQYPQLLAKMDELERSIELEALAKGAGFGLWAITTWGLLQLVVEVPRLPLFTVAPVIAVFYAIARWHVVRKYR